MDDFSKLADQVKFLDTRINAINQVLEYIESELKDEIWDNNESCHIQITSIKKEYEKIPMESSNQINPLQEMFGYSSGSTATNKKPVQKRSTKNFQLIGTSPILFFNYVRDLYIKDKEDAIRQREDVIKTHKKGLLAEDRNRGLLHDTDE